MYWLGPNAKRYSKYCCRTRPKSKANKSSTQKGNEGTSILGTYAKFLLSFFFMCLFHLWRWWRFIINGPHKENFLNLSLHPLLSYLIIKAHWFIYVRCLFIGLIINPGDYPSSLILAAIRVNVLTDIKRIGLLWVADKNK